MSEPGLPPTPSAATRDLIARDLASVWHPFTQHAMWAYDEPLVIERGEGMHLVDSDGMRYLDGVSSLWVTVHGHGVPEIDEAIRRQLGRLDHSTFLGLTHEPGIELAEKLLATAPVSEQRRLSRVFYAGDGASAVEAAIKMAFQAKAQRGEDRPLYLHVAEGYHGDTLGAVSVGGIDLFHHTYRPILLDTLMVSSPGVRAAGQSPRRPRRRGARRDARAARPRGPPRVRDRRRAARAGGGGDAHPRPVVPARHARARRRARRLPRRRRGGHRHRAHRHVLGRRAGRRRARPADLRQGPHRPDTCRCRRCSPPRRSTSRSSARRPAVAPSSTATATPPTRCARRPPSRTSTSWRRTARSRNAARVGERIGELTADLAAYDGVLEIRRIGTMTGIEVRSVTERTGMAVTAAARDARRADPTARRRDRADASARDRRRRPRDPRRHGRRVHPRGRAMSDPQAVAADPHARLREHAERRREAGLRRSLTPREHDDDVLDLAGNDYLGLARDPRVVEGAVDAVRRWGAGATGSRLVTGSTRAHARPRGRARRARRRRGRARALERVRRQPRRGRRPSRSRATSS